MRLPSHPDFHLTYCTNIHPADGWENVRATLAQYAPALRARFAPESAFAGLRLSRKMPAACHGNNLEERLPRGLRALRRDYQRLSHGLFHGTLVKASVYAPDWRDPARVAYTLDLVRILGTCCCPGSTASRPPCFQPGLRFDDRSWEPMIRHVVGRRASSGPRRDRHAGAPGYRASRIDPRTPPRP